MENIIGICGWKGAGKDTIGQFFIQNHGYEKDSFAKSLKDMASVIFNWDRNLLEGITVESREWREQPDIWWENQLNWANHKGSKLSEHFTPRFALQYLGTQLFRDQFHSNLWVLSMQNRLKDKNKVVITDCRFPNELQMIKDLGGKIIWVKRGPNPEWFEQSVTSGILGAEIIRRGGAPWDLAECYPYGCFEQIFVPLMEKSSIHESEWRWCGWDFDYVIENDGSIDNLYSELGDL